MIPEGKVLGDRTLIHLAKLSKEAKNPHVANNLLLREVEHRNAPLSSAAQIPALTNSDISRVLATFEPINFEAGDIINGSRHTTATGDIQSEPTRPTSMPGGHMVSDGTDQVAGPLNETQTLAEILEELPEIPQDLLQTANNQKNLSEKFVCIHLGAGKTH